MEEPQYEREIKNDQPKTILSKLNGCGTTPGNQVLLFDLTDNSVIKYTIIHHKTIQTTLLITRA